MRSAPRTKIIGTIGPASDRSGVLRRMIRAGMDVVRLNFSHGSLEGHRQRIQKVKEFNKKYRRRIRILGDLEGHRIRIGRLKGGGPVGVKKGQSVWLTPRDVLGEGDVIPFDYRGPLARIKKGQLVYIDDGNIALRAEAAGKIGVRARVLTSGAIRERKGVNMPGVPLSEKGLTPEDRRNLDFCIEHEVDDIALSFVQNPDDVLCLREYLEGCPHPFRVIAKIEDREGIKNIDGIIRVSDGVMVARGDLGVSIPVYEVPLVQKAIIRKCNRAGKIAVTATQMLESMTENRIPTRAEVSDVANAILDGTDYVMLSAETAVGRHPVEAVAMMNRIIRHTEQGSR
ncbi:MAG: pyruvate kinase [Candidatus Omnitrophota bacterium]|nr:pyruvate kinase [Candidatus Omnitrophota bacterium]MDZ4243419.1 pyruvate kinase [Candidatus Omnitrophota bacterium]